MAFLDFWAFDWNKSLNISINVHQILYTSTFPHYHSCKTAYQIDFFSLFFSHLFLHKKLKLSADEALKQKHDCEFIILLCINVYEGPRVHRFQWFTHYLIGNIYFSLLMNLQIRSKRCPFCNLKMPIFMTDYLLSDHRW